MDAETKSEGRYLPFFVYGTLLPDQPNYHLWGDEIVAEQTAALANGRLYDMGHYPMLVEGGSGAVRGLLITASRESYHDLLTRLDRLEGYDAARPDASMYCRVERAVVLADGRSQSAWVYMGHARYVAGLAPIEGGDWAAYVATELDRVRAWWVGIDSV